MLLDCCDYEYSYYRQARGRDGLSGKIYLGKPLKRGLKPILVKSSHRTEAINEYVECNLGRRIGVNTPQAWLFEVNEPLPGLDIDFTHAVGIEYLEGLQDTNIGSFETEELAVQTIKGVLLHALMGEEDNVSLGLWNGKIYAFDFAEGNYSDWDMYFTPEGYEDVRFNGFKPPQLNILNKVSSIRKNIDQYLRRLDEFGVTWKIVADTHGEFRRDYLEFYGRRGFTDMIQEIECVYTPRLAKYIDDLFGAMQQGIVAPF